jgi:Ni/Co efflux regulator RcnB
MQRIAVLVLAIFCFAPLTIATAQAADGGFVLTTSHNTQCRRHKSKKESEDKPKKKKGKEEKKPYGFEL